MKKTNKLVTEIIFWIIINLPFIFLFLYLDYLSQNIWSVGIETRLTQLFFPIGITLLFMSLFNKLLYPYLYKYVLIKVEGDNYTVSLQGRSFLKNIFIKRKRLFVYTGIDNDNKMKYFYDKHNNSVTVQLWG